MRKRLLTFIILIYTVLFISCARPAQIDRFALVNRHNIINPVHDSLSSLTIGNGGFAFTADLTGLQTFPDNYSRGIPLGTMSDWSWNTAMNPENYGLSDVYRTHNVNGREVDYVSQYRKGEDSRKVAASDWLRANPHRIHLGLIGLQLLKQDGSEISINDITKSVQKLNLWTGEMESRFIVDGRAVRVLTVCHPDDDIISVKVASELITAGRLKVRIRFPFGAATSFGMDLKAIGEHTTEILSDSNNITLFGRKQDNDRYYVLVSGDNAVLKKDSGHIFLLEPSTTDTVYSFSCHFFRDEGQGIVRSFNETEDASARSWKRFWETGGAVDFSGCSDPRAMELERRVVLSRYLTRVQCSGSYPPAETGLTYNSWFGKFHIEMHWWHSVHFALWQKEEILEKQMKYYGDIHSNAKKTAEKQGYKGVRWPKMTGPDGKESPSAVGTYLIWQQPHFIFFAELLYKNAKNKQEILDKYKDLVFETADFMASYATYDSVNDRYCLGPVLIPAQESLSRETTINPSFELVYWYWGLKTALAWKQRLHEDIDPVWKNVMEKISALPVQNGLYLCSEDTKDTWLNERYMSDHPIISGISGLMPVTKLVDKKILANSLDTIMKKWNWKTTWGWDFPMLAMSAASIGREEQAIDFLMMNAPKNVYLMNGHNYQDSRLSIYLPGNGGLLTSVALMCLSDQFPHNGKWHVKWENLNKYVD
jgi:hypothetical protein